MITRPRNMQGKRRKPNRVRRHLKNLQAAPLKRWRDGQAVVSNADKSLGARRVESLLVPYVFALIAKKDREIMSAFLNCGFFEGHPPKAADILQRSVEWHFGCRKKRGALYDRCWTYANAMKEAFAEDMGVDELAVLLRGGIENLSRCRTVSESTDLAAGSEDETEDQDEEDDFGEDEEKEDVNASNDLENSLNGIREGDDHSRGSHKAAAVRTKKERPLKIDFASDIILSGGSEHIKLILEAGIETRLRFDVVVDDIDDDNWTKLKVLTLRMLK